MTEHHMRLDRSIPWRIGQAIARVVSMVLFDLEVGGSEHVPARGGALIVSNHQSYLDPMLLPVRLERPLNYIAKSELFEGRIRGWLLRSVLNAFPVRLGRTDVGAVKETIHRLRDGHLVNLYPEGARTFDGEIGPLRPGVGLIARRAGVPIVPAVICGSFEAWPRQRRLFRPAPIRVRFGPAIDLGDASDDEILAIVDRTLRAMFRALRDERAAASPTPSPGDP